MQDLALVWSFPDTAVRSAPKDPDSAGDQCGDKADSWAPDQVFKCRLLTLHSDTQHQPHERSDVSGRGAPANVGPSAPPQEPEVSAQFLQEDPL